MRLSAGNTADAPELEPMVRQSIAATGVIPHQVIADDGYASAAGREHVLRMGVASLVISGAKGRKLVPTTEWDATAEARASRSAVESLIFTLKYVHEFGQLRRRGIEAVRAEMLEKIIAYNFRRMTQVRELQAEARRPSCAPAAA